MVALCRQLGHAVAISVLCFPQLGKSGPTCKPLNYLCAGQCKCHGIIGWSGLEAVVSAFHPMLCLVVQPSSALLDATPYMFVCLGTGGYPGCCNWMGGGTAAESNVLVGVHELQGRRTAAEFRLSLE